MSAARKRKPTRAAHLGVTDQEYAAMLKRQGGCCAICGTAPKTRRLNVDHDHRSGEVRGLLCHRCNRALPNWISATWLARAAAYIAPEYPHGNADLRSAVIELYEQTV